MLNVTSLDTLCTSLCKAMEIAAPKKSAAANEELTTYVNEVFDSRKADRIFMYYEEVNAKAAKIIM